jgi:hypothetical protein
MKKNLILIALLAWTCSAGAQENSKMQLPVIGVGLHVEQFKLGDVLNNNLPANSILLTFNIHNVFRIEPEYGYYSGTDDATGASPELKHSSGKFGLGMYYMFQEDNFNFSLGGLYNNYSISSDDYAWAGSGYTVYTTETKMNGFGPALTGEYFFGKHFSFGGNIALLFSSKQIKLSTSDNKTTSSLSQTQTGLQARFYF